jgi:hypothetical protein
MFINLKKRAVEQLLDEVAQPGGGSSSDGESYILAIAETFMGIQTYQQVNIDPPHNNRHIQSEQVSETASPINIFKPS